MFYKDFYHREMWYLNTRKNTIFLHVKISIMSLTSGLSLKLYLNSLVYHRNIFGSSLKVLGNLRTSSEIFGNSRKMFGNVRLVFGTIWKGGWKSSENHQKRRHQYVYFINRIIHGRLEIWNLSSRVHIRYLTRSISMWTLEDKFHFSARPCIILYVFIAELHARMGGAPLLSKSTHPRKFGNHVTVHRPPTDRPSASQENQCLLSHFN